MNYRSSSYTQRAPRTLEQAFGSYTSRDFVEPKVTFDWQDKVVLAGCLIAFTVLLVLCSLGVV